MFSNMDFMTPANSKASKAMAEALERKKKKYYIQYVDSNLETATSNSTPHNTNEVKPAARPQGRKRMILIAMNYMRLFLLSAVVGLGVTVALGGSSRWTLMLLLSGIDCVLALGVAHGIPSATALYAQQLLQDDSLHALLLSFALYMHAPLVLAVFPLCSRALFFVSSALEGGVLRLGMMRSIRPVLSPWLVKLNQQQGTVSRMTPQVEVVLLLVFMLRLFSSSGSLLGVVLYGQYIRIRYILSPAMQMFWRGIKSTTDRYFIHHPSCPAIVTKVYGWVCWGLHKLVEVRSQ